MQALPELSVQRIDKDRLGLAVIMIFGAPLGTAGCDSRMDPVGRLVARAVKPGRVHKGFQKGQRHVIEIKPILFEELGIGRQDL